jgi:tyrosyl-DNA phosphodiesterase 2
LLQARLDRVLCKLSGWRAQAIEMIGTTPIDGVQHVKTFSSGRQRTLPVYPSDHFGLLLTLVPSQGSVAAQQT